MSADRQNWSGLGKFLTFPSTHFQFRTETFLSIFLGWLQWSARFWEVQAVGKVVKISIQQRWASERLQSKHPRKPLQNHHYADLWAKRPKEMVSGMHIKGSKNGKQVKFSFSKIWWASKVSLLAIENDCVARSYRFSVPLTCTRAIIRQKVYWADFRCPQFSFLRWLHFQECTQYNWIRELKVLKMRVRSFQVVALVRWSQGRVWLYTWIKNLAKISLFRLSTNRCCHWCWSLRSRSCPNHLKSRKSYAKTQTPLQVRLSPLCGTSLFAETGHLPFLAVHSTPF